MGFFRPIVKTMSKMKISGLILHQRTSTRHCAKIVYLLESSLSGGVLHTLFFKRLGQFRLPLQRVFIIKDKIKEQEDTKVVSFCKIDGKYELYPYCCKKNLVGHEKKSLASFVYSLFRFALAGINGE